MPIPYFLFTSVTTKLIIIVIYIELALLINIIKPITSENKFCIKVRTSIERHFKALIQTYTFTLSPPEESPKGL